MNLRLATFALIVAATPVAAEVNIYSSRQPELVQPLLDAFTEATGIQTNVAFLDKGMVQRLQAEGARSPADLVLTVDISRLSVYADKDLLAVTSSDVLNRNIPAYLRGPKGRWYASVRIRETLVIDLRCSHEHTAPCQ